MTDELKMENVKKTPNIRKTFHTYVQNITVEPLMIFFLMPFAMSALTIQNLSLDKACRVNLELNTRVCDALQHRNHSGYNESDEVMVQRVVASSYIWKNVIYGVFPAILLPIFGAWSDRNGARKVLTILPLMGEVISNVGFLLCTYFYHQLPMEVNIVIEVLPTALTGGTNMFLLGIFTYVADISKPEERTLRIGVVHILLMLTTTIGFALSGIMYNLVGFYGVFSVSLILYFIGGVYAKYYVHDRQPDEKQKFYNEKGIKDILNLKDTLTMFQFLVKPQNPNKRKQIVAILVLAVLVLGPFIGEGTVLYLYTRFKFGWDEIGFSIFYSYYCVAHLIGSVIALALFSKYLGIDDALLGAISSMSKICGAALYILAKIPVLFYAATLLEIFNGTAFIASRSIVTKLVSPQELGKFKK
ncbi:hypothetical protein FQA39_LY18977 [Lamprigera yunnana]|nr:hypothetical protein FQA39_LY18977 [Lamprigera yunnana]